MLFGGRIIEHIQNCDKRVSIILIAFFALQIHRCFSRILQCLCLLLNFAGMCLHSSNTLTNLICHRLHTLTLEICEANLCLEHVDAPQWVYSFFQHINWQGPSFIYLKNCLLDRTWLNIDLNTPYLYVETDRKLVTSKSAQQNTIANNSFTSGCRQNYRFLLNICCFDIIQKVCLKFLCSGCTTKCVL